MLTNCKEGQITISKRKKLSVWGTYSRQAKLALSNKLSASTDM